MTSWSDMPGRGSKRSSLRAVSGGFMGVSGLVMLIGTVFVFSQFATLLEDRSEDLEVGGFAQLLIENRWLVALPALLAVGCGVLLFFIRPTGLRIALLLVGWTAMLMPIAALLYALIAILAPLYAPVEL